MFFWGDPTFILLIPALIFAFYAQFKVQSSFNKYSKERGQKGYSGADVARDILDRVGLDDVPIEVAKGQLSDHYDPKNRVMRLSSEVYHGNSIASLGVAAHETGHAIQHMEGYTFLNVRNAVFPIAAFGSQAAFPIFFIGFLFSSNIGYTLMTVGIYLFLAALAFQVITLPVEFNASKKAIVLLNEGNYLTTTETKKARKVLTAAALTYIAAVAMSATQILRLLILRGSRRD
ncbi:MAG: zinc metallopeptidase [Firmicutes bacterium]|nr:zinc metallopeptidase [Bacillota bacterium]MDD4264534.1 zinc metallopeptidase [Bacillota bacterium]MDD4694316.1 zinc metallopeptidase [Bacillota bacterium]